MMVSFKNFAGLEFGRSIILYVLFLISFLGIVGLHLFGIAVGTTYFIITVGSMLTFILLPPFIKNVRLPIAKTTKFGAASLIGGMILPVLAKLIANVSTWKFMAPFQLFGIGAQSVASYESLLAQSSPLFSVFTTIFTAGVLEELVLGFAPHIAGIGIGYLIFKEALGMDISKGQGRLLMHGAGFATAMIVFSLAHFLNPSYAGIMFFIAAGFRAVMNFVMFYWLNIEFTIGFHMANNGVFLGAAAILAGLTTFAGTIFVVLFIAIVIIAIKWLRNRKLR